MIQLIVKGNSVEAEEAAKKRGIHIDILRKLNWNQSICEVRDEYEIAAIKWFLETDYGDCDSVNGYPIGACLHYTFRT